MTENQKTKMFDKANISAFLYRNKKGLATLTSIFFGFVLSFIVIAIMGYNPFDILDGMLKSAFDKFGVWETIQTWALFTILGLAVAIGFKAGLFNIGVAGQMVFGGMAGYLFVFANPDMAPGAMIPLLFIISITAATAFGLVAAVLKAFFGVHEVITTIMLNWVAVKITYSLVQNGNIKSDNGNITSVIPTNLSDSLESMSKNITWILVAAILAVIAAFVVLKFTKLGLKIKVSGQSFNAAKYAGYRSKALVIGVMGVSAAIAGLAAIAYYFHSSSHVTSSTSVGQTDFSFPPEIGFVGIAIALIAMNNPIMIVPAAFMFAILQGNPALRGVDALGVKNLRDIAKLFGAIIVYFVAISNVFIYYLTPRQIKAYFKRIASFYSNDQIKVSTKFGVTLANIFTLGIYSYARKNWNWVENISKRKETNVKEVANV